MRPNIKSRTAIATWQTIGAGYESSQSTELINHYLTKLTQKRLPVFLANKGYQSGYTLLLSVSDKGLLIDKPPKCPAGKDKIRVIFKDESRLTTHFDVQIVAVHDDTLQTTRPQEIIRLQRRADFRVDMPQGSHVSFKVNGSVVTGLPIKNISAGGMLFCTKKSIDLPKSSISDITLSIPSSDSDDLQGGWLLRRIRKGEVVRAFRDKRLGIDCFGVAFQAKDREEDELVRYIRLRERELLSKGFSS